MRRLIRARLNATVHEWGVCVAEYALLTDLNSPREHFASIHGGVEFSKLACGAGDHDVRIEFDYHAVLTAVL